MDKERAALSDQPEALDEIAPGRLIFMPGVDERDVERAVLLTDFLEAFANIEIAAPIVDGQAIAEIVGATTSAGRNSTGRSRRIAVRSK
jgi:hypothetical protein